MACECGALMRRTIRTIVLFGVLLAAATVLAGAGETLKPAAPPASAGPNAARYAAHLDARFPAADLLSDEGYNKQVYSVAGRPDLALRVLRERGKSGHHGQLGPWSQYRVDEFAAETDRLRRLKQKYDLPVALPIEHGSYRGRPADVMHRYTMGLIGRWWRTTYSDDQKTRLAKVAGALFGAPSDNQRALDGLAKIQAAFDKGLVINDFQLLIDKGRIDVSDILRSTTSASDMGVSEKEFADKRADQSALVADLTKLVRSLRLPTSATPSSAAAVAAQ